MQVIAQAGIGWTRARTWEGSRDRERQQLKRQGGAPDALVLGTVGADLVWLVTGEVCGRGSDGEPLLAPASARVLAELSGDQTGFHVPPTVVALLREAPTA
ncbi:MAG: hypothetical protein ABSG43_20760 [Solirubrobacteraceae bacterium]